MTKAQQRKLGAVEAEVVASVPAVVSGEGVAVVAPPTFEGWEADDLLAWIRQEAFKVEAAEGWVEENRFALGAALHMLRDLVGEGTYGTMVKELAESAGVSARTLQRWRSSFEEKANLPPPKKAAKRVESRRGRKPPELTTGVVSDEETPPDAPVSAPEAPTPQPEPVAPVEPPAPPQEPPVEQQTAPSAPPAPTPSKAEQIDAIFDRFFASDPRAVALLSDVKAGTARARAARRWVDAYEMAVKGVAPLAAVTPLRTTKPATDRTMVSPNFKAPKK